MLFGKVHHSGQMCVRQPPTVALLGALVDGTRYFRLVRLGRAFETAELYFQGYKIIRNDIKDGGRVRND